MAKTAQTDRERFWQSAEEAARRVAAWPEWKQYPKPADIVAQGLKRRTGSQPERPADPVPPSGAKPRG